MFDKEYVDTKRLMVGDWVLSEGVPTRITQINDEGDVWTEHNPFTENEDIHPIELTDEILERNEFDGYPDNKQYYLFPNDESLVILVDRDSEDGLRYCVGHLDYDEKETFHPFIYVDFVHELQHILNLFGLMRFNREFVV